MTDQKKQIPQPTITTKDGTQIYTRTSWRRSNSASSPPVRASVRVDQIKMELGLSQKVANSWLRAKIE